MLSSSSLFPTGGPTMPPPRFTFTLFCVLIRILPSYASTLFINRTIDDQLGDPVTGIKPIYLPDGPWNFGPTCTHCNLNTMVIDKSHVFEGTWHDVLYRVGDSTPTVSLSFLGTAVYVYFIVANTVPETTTLVNVSFYLDGNEGSADGTFFHAPDSTTNVEYNVLAFARRTLANHAHTLVIISGGGSSESVMLFDYMVYTAEIDDTPATRSPTSGTISLPSSSTTQSLSSSVATQPLCSASHPSIGVIAGSIVGGLIVLSALCIVALVLIRKPCLERRIRKITSDESCEWSLLNGPVGSWQLTHIPASKIDILVMESPPRPEHEVTRREKELQQRIDILEMQLRNMPGTTPHASLIMLGPRSLRSWKTTAATILTSSSSTRAFHAQLPSS